MVSAKDLKAISSSLNVLYVEDEEILRDAMQNSLSKLFQNSYVANNGLEAFEILKREEIDLVITDINMPIMDGVELIKNIHQLRDKEPTIIVLSAHDESMLLQSLINLGIDYFLNKPIDKEMMINQLYKACSKITNKRLVVEYSLMLKNEFLATKRKNTILEQKLKQLAVERNKNSRITDQCFIGKKEKDTLIQDSYFINLLKDDREELEDLSDELDGYITMLFQNDTLNSSYLDKLSQAYKKYASVINTYPEFSSIADSLFLFSNAMITLENKFMEDLQQTGIYFESLQLTLDTYRKNIWNQEAPDPQFYNASLKVDIQAIIDFLEGKEQEYNEMEFF